MPSRAEVPYTSTAMVKVRAGGLRKVLVEDGGLDEEVADGLIEGLVRDSGKAPDPPPAGSGIRGFFINRGSGAVQRVVKVDASYAQIEKVDGTGHWSMPIAEYDGRFVELYRPATVDDLSVMTPDEYRAPANAPDDWP